jgi:AraC family transcriptional regulator
MPDTASIVQAIDFIEDNLREPIGVADMAAAVSYSLYHYCRTFNQATHHTPYDYLMRRRLADAARALLETDGKIIEVALDYQFNNPETFSRAFKRVLGWQPSQWRKTGQLDPRRLMPRLTQAHIEQIARGAHPKPEVLETEAFQIAGLMTTVRDDSTEIPRLWALLARELSSCEDPASTGDYCALSTYPDDWTDAGYLYLAAVEAKGLGTQISSLVLKAIPALTCARVSHAGTCQDRSLALDYFYHTWLPKAGWSASPAWVIERFSQEPPEAEGAASEREFFIPLR